MLVRILRRSAVLPPAAAEQRSLSVPEFRSGAIRRSPSSNPNPEQISRGFFFLFDLLFLDGADLRSLPLIERKDRLKALLADAPSCLQYTDHQIGRGPAFHRLACEHGLEGIVSKRVNAPYEPGRRSWLKVKCLNRDEFIVVGWSEPEGTRHRLGSLLLGYYTPEGKLTYAGRAGTGMPDKELERLWRKLQLLRVDKMPLAEAPPRGRRFGSPLVLSRVDWGGPE